MPKLEGISRVYRSFLLILLLFPLYTLDNILLILTYILYSRLAPYISILKLFT